MNTDKNGFRRIIRMMFTWGRPYSGTVILRRIFSRRISGIIRILLILPFLSACAASTDWNNPCDQSGTTYSVTECAKKQQGGGSQAKGVPSIPSGLTATSVSSAQINLSWTDNSNNEIGFIIERKTGTAGTYDAIGNVGANVTSFQDTTVACATTYYYRVKANNSAGDSDYSNEANTTTNTCSSLVPTAPSGLTAYSGYSSQVDLSWQDNSNNEDGFKIERKTGAGGTYSQIGTVSANITSYQDTSLTCNTIYYYRVRANNSVGDSSYSNEANSTTSACPATTPTAPSNLAATVVSSSEIDLSWTDNASNEDGFKIERKTGSTGTYTQIGTASANITSYQDTGLTCATTYYYRAKANNGAGDSSYSNETNVTTGICSGTVPAAPSNFIAVGTSNVQIDLTWKDNSNNEDGFKIERKIGSGGTYSLIFTASSNATTYSDTGLSAGTIYYYRVNAYNSAGNSGYSNEVSGATMASISGGCFNMGDAFNEGSSASNGGGNELPVHNVCISAFQMDVYEVTNAQYKQCVDSGICTAPGNSSSDTRSSYYGNSTYDNYPVIYVNWSQANTYCNWIQLKRLPTEAEWEYAARGGLSGKRFPWGDTISCANANYYPDTQYSYDTQGSTGYCVGGGDTLEVGSYSANGYGLFDMAGNVWEWVNDWYSDTYYSSSPTNDPTGPSSGSQRVLRGGAWNSGALHLRTSMRYIYFSQPSSQYEMIGFRCAK